MWDRKVFEDGKVKEGIVLYGREGDIISSDCNTGTVINCCENITFADV